MAFPRKKRAGLMVIRWLTDQISIVMKRISNLKWFLSFALILFLISCRRESEQKIVILATTDLHGVILPYDFTEGEPLDVSLANAFSYIQEVRKENKAVILLDDGDNLQGQPEVYYFNYIDTISPHLNAEAMNFAGYDATTAGNHDIEAGHKVYDRLVKEYNFPVLAANAVDIKSGKPYFKPYIILERNGIKVAILGLITPSVPTWLPPELYSGIEFRDMVATAKEWMPVIMKENPDLIVGLFHSGWDGSEAGGNSQNYDYEDGSASVAQEVPGFDIIFTGHDHNVLVDKIVNYEGDTVLILDGGSKAEKIARADVLISPEKNGHQRTKKLAGDIVNVNRFKPESSFIKKFSGENEKVREYVDKVIAQCEDDITTRDSYFGSSPFVDLIHKIQLEITGADISFAAPLSFDVKISRGDVKVGDMFKLYRFENMLYTINMKGSEIKKYLNFSYSQWLNTMSGPDDYLLKYRLNKQGKPQLSNGRAWLRNQPYNFDSATGINYLVDSREPEGKRINIISMSDGEKFDLNKTYKVAVNSYRGSGGGGHLAAAGISGKELPDRLINSTEKDLRYYILKSLESKKIIKPLALNNWKIVPEEWVRKAKNKELKLLFETEN
jgi:2',3'-cyclic-nucleotide 2'-phosphodiesterase/3'-nucleotidase